MHENMIAAKAALAVTLGSVAAFLGWRSIMVLVWVALMALDYLSGTIAARQNGTWKSETARAGVWHKGGMVLIVLVCAITDLVMITVCDSLPNDILAIEWPVVIFPMVTIWYILTEIGSIIENAIAMGAPVPSWLPKIIDATKHVVDTAGEQVTADGAAEVFAKEYADDHSTSGLLE